jgi:hypothetical protein
MPERILDLFIEFRNRTNGLSQGARLINALIYFGLDPMDAVEKKEMQEAIGSDRRVYAAAARDVKLYTWLGIPSIETSPWLSSAGRAPSPSKDHRADASGRREPARQAAYQGGQERRIRPLLPPGRFRFRCQGKVRHGALSCADFMLVFFALSRRLRPSGVFP